MYLYDRNIKPLDTLCKTTKLVKNQLSWSAKLSCDLKNPNFYSFCRLTDWIAERFALQSSWILKRSPTSPSQENPSLKDIPFVSRAQKFGAVPHPVRAVSCSFKVPQQSTVTAHICCWVHLQSFTEVLPWGFVKGPLLKSNSENSAFLTFNVRLHLTECAADFGNCDVFTVYWW